MAYIQKNQSALGQPRGGSRSRHSPAKHHDKEIIQNTIQHRSPGDRRCGELWIPVSFHQNLKRIRDDKAPREWKNRKNIMFHILHSHFRGPQKYRGGFKIDEDPCRYYGGNNQQGGQPLGVHFIRFLLLPFSKVYGHNGRCAHSEQYRYREKKIHKWRGDIYSGQSHLRDSSGHKHPVNHGVQGKYPLSGDRRPYKSPETCF